MKHLEKICEEVATIALTQYETHKYHYHFTLWGICYHWPKKNLSGNQSSLLCSSMQKRITNRS